MDKYILIKADTNDADYITSCSIITDEEIEEILPVIEAIKNFKPYKGVSKRGSEWVHDSNYPKYENCRSDLGEKNSFELYGHIPGYDSFDELVPIGQYGIHSIESIEIIQILDILL